MFQMKSVFLIVTVLNTYTFNIKIKVNLTKLRKITNIHEGYFIIYTISQRSLKNTLVKSAFLFSARNYINL